MPSQRSEDGSILPFPRFLETEPSPVVLSREQQQGVLGLLMKGASPQLACQEQRVPMARFWATLAADDAFAEGLQQLFDTLSHNVLSALYHAAMKGNITAQQFWLKHRPAKGWLPTPEGELEAESLSEWSDAELLERWRSLEPLSSGTTLAEPAGRESPAPGASLGDALPTASGSRGSSAAPQP